MSNIEILKDLHEKQQLRPLVMAGLMPAKVLAYMEMFYHVDKQVKTGQKKQMAICLTAACFKVHPKTVTRAIENLTK